MIDKEREKLPYRETSDCFLIYKNKLVCKDFKKYLGFPGGGVDPGENPLDAAKRECMEETGAQLSGLKHIITIYWDWFPEWASNDKRKQRYAEFRGEKIHLLIGKVEKFMEPTSTEGDAWKGRLFMSFDKVLALHDEYAKTDHPNMYPYRVAQYSIMKMLKEKCKSV